MNLARSWRPKTFDEIVGQELTVRILKNSLYRNQLFPVYLLAGQRGCGKTTTGRVFAAAINCEMRADFSRDPQNVVLPCLSCQSCRAMTAGHHPDFIEIDAASHTGVDNVRALIESSSYLPVLGAYKIYLIDEAHMLSKAAFNAFLKILEEPSVNVIFMLATTDAHKIIDTVTSRCFQLFFDPLDTAVLCEHVAAVCRAEQIPFDEAGISVIVQKSSGSVRDALNILERVRLAASEVTAQSAAAALGIVDTVSVIEVLEKVVAGTVIEVLAHGALRKSSARDFFEQVRSVVRACVYQSHGVSHHMAEYATLLAPLAARVSVQQWLTYWHILYDAELAFNKTSAQHEMLELILISMTTTKGAPMPQGGHADLPSKPVAKPLESVVAGEKITPKQSQADQSPTAQSSTGQSTSARAVFHEPAGAPVHTTVGGASHQWQNFLDALSARNPLLFSLFKQGVPHRKEQNELCVEFPQKLHFFKEKFVESRAVWQPLLDESYGSTLRLEPVFLQNAAAPSPVQEIKRAPIKQVEKTPVTHKSYAGEQVDRITRVFPGTIEEIT